MKHTGRPATARLRPRFREETEREAKIARFKAEAPELQKSDRRSSAQSMAFALFAVVGVVGVLLLMDALDRVDPEPESGLIEVDTIPEAPLGFVNELLTRLEREASEAGHPGEEETVMEEPFEWDLPPLDPDLLDPPSAPPALQGILPVAPPAPPLPPAELPALPEP